MTFIGNVSGNRNDSGDVLVRLTNVEYDGLFRLALGNDGALPFELLAVIQTADEARQRLSVALDSLAAATAPAVAVKP